MTTQAEETKGNTKLESDIQVLLEISQKEKAISESLEQANQKAQQIIEEARRKGKTLISQAKEKALKEKERERAIKIEHFQKQLKATQDKIGSEMDALLNKARGRKPEMVRIILESLVKGES